MGLNFRYLFYDTWNILDIITILEVAMAFVCRVVAIHRGENWSISDEGTEDSDEAAWFFASQLLMAMAAPLLFARLLFLSQVDKTLGPMAQVFVTNSQIIRGKYRTRPSSESFPFLISLCLPVQGSY